MKPSIRSLAAAAGLVLASGAAFADGPIVGTAGGYDDTDFADVVRVEPLRRQVRVSEPVRECWRETSYASEGPFSYNHIGGTLLGSALGVALGNQIGHGRGKDVARVAGALVGGAIGHNVSVDRQRQLGGARGQTHECCDVRYRDRYEERIDGYEVTYAYAGREYVTRMPYDPGERIRVRVDVSPADG
ncbi:MAG: glycine zipper 2TM domain-containing protein [Gammaproteobacteria bacterium]|nr:glycine zipper 2TM domain-containing protein [Gammaproteobacteria bacterium]